MKVYTEEQLLDICQSVAEKVCAYSISTDTIKDYCEYFENTKLNLIVTDSIKKKINNDDVEKILLVDYDKVVPPVNI